jgi:aspartate-semialdehyde dehydrogenase
VSTGPRIVVVGAATEVGREICSAFPSGGARAPELVALDAAERAGVEIDHGSNSIWVREVTAKGVENAALVIFAGDTVLPSRYLEAATGPVLDATGFCAKDPEVPLVVPELNADAISDARVVATPRPIAVQALLALAPIAAIAGLESVSVFATRGASVGGTAAMDELRDQTVALLNFRDPIATVLPRRLAFDLLAHATEVDSDGHARDERAVMGGVRRLLGADLPVQVTSVLGPFFVGCGLSLHVRTARPTTRAALAEALAAAPGLDLRPDDEAPSAVDAAGAADVLVSRLRVADGGRAVSLWTAGDDVQRCGAGNAVRLAARLLIA